MNPQLRKCCRDQFAPCSGLHARGALETPPVCRLPGSERSWHWHSIKEVIVGVVLAILDTPPDSSHRGNQAKTPEAYPG